MFLSRQFIYSGRFDLEDNSDFQKVCLLLFWDSLKEHTIQYVHFDGEEWYVTVLSHECISQQGAFSL